MSFNYGTDTCANIDTWKCSECVHEEREDYYEVANPELKAKREAEYLKELFEAMPKENLSVSISEDFMKDFVISKKYTATTPRCCCVYCANDYVLATDSMRMIKINTDVPNEFRGKHIIDIQNGEAFIHLEPANVFYVNGSAINKFNQGNAQIITTKQKFRELLTNCKEYNESSWVDKKFIIQDKYLEDIIELIPNNDEEITIKHGGQCEPVTFGFKRYEILVMPVKPHNYSKSL